MNEKQLAKLIKKNQEKAVAKDSKARVVRAFDPTLVTKEPDDAAELERLQMFKELKRRDF